MSRINVLHLTDTLDAGGAERVAVNLVNLLPRDRCRPHLCTTRRDGPLAELVSGDVTRICLGRKWRFERAALAALLRFIRQHEIQILHAHGTAVAMASIASLFFPSPIVVWHDHFGPNAQQERPAWIYRLLARRVRGVLAVSRPLAEWSCTRLHVPRERVWYVPNFVPEQSATTASPLDLPGTAGKRIVCVANLRPVKDQITLLRAMARVAAQVPETHLLLVGATDDAAYVQRLKQTLGELNLSRHVSLLGRRNDVLDVLRGCDIGVLSSVSEGFPLSLLEYGIARLPVVATQVGECPDVLENGKAGLVVAPQSPEALAQALISLLSSAELRAALGQRLCERVSTTYSAASVITQVMQIYDQTLLSTR